MIAFGLSVLLCGSSIQNIWMKWRTYPVIMTLTERDSSIASIPFPMVTICPQTKTYQSKLDVTSAYRTLKESKELLSDTEYTKLQFSNSQKLNFLNLKFFSLKNFNFFFNLEWNKWKLYHTFVNSNFRKTLVLGVNLQTLQFTTLSETSQ